MSKAFTRENDDAPESGSSQPARAATLPPGARNYVTADGAAAFREELVHLTQQVRPSLASATDAESKSHLEGVEARVRDLSRILRTAVVPRPPPPGEACVRFGAWVTARSLEGTETQYRIVGVDETDPARGWVSWVSPLARALIGARCGDRVTLVTPEGEELLEIREVAYALVPTSRGPTRAGTPESETSGTAGR